jgi:hypothetical protein
VDHSGASDKRKEVTCLVLAAEQAKSIICDEDLKEDGVRVCDGFNWLRIGSRDGLS